MGRDEIVTVLPPQVSARVPCGEGDRRPWHHTVRETSGAPVCPSPVIWTHFMAPILVSVLMASHPCSQYRAGS